MSFRRFAVGVVAVALACPAIVWAAPVTPQNSRWPSMATQLSKDHVPSGSELERFIRENQNFSMLDDSERDDTIPVPFWLRVAFRKAHPELEFSANDPTHGYPLALKEAHDWMRLHPDLRTGPTEPTILPDGILRTTVGSNVRVSGAQTVPRSESDIRINFNNPSQVISASNNIGGSGLQGEYWSTDGGTTWGQTNLPIVTGDSFHSDPTVDWTSDGTAWSTTIGINSTGTTLKMRAYKSTSGGASWTFDATFSGSQTSTDKQMVWIDHSASSPFKDNIYAAWHNGAPEYFNKRTGPAGSWGTPKVISGAETTGTAIGTDVKTNANGDLFVAWPSTGNSRIIFTKSTDGGATFSTPVSIRTTFDSYDIGVPAMNNRRALVYVTLAAYRNASKNMVYATWTDLSGDSGCTSPGSEPGANTASTCKSRIWFARSSDGGATWGTAVRLNHQASLNDQFNQWMAVDETTGRVAVMYYDTVGNAGRKKTDVWYQTSGDDGATWSAAFKVTSTQTDETIAGSDSGNQYGDYNGMTGFSGKFMPSWTDRRSGGREEIWTAAVTENPCTAPPAPTGLTATAVGTNRIDLVWGASSGATEYHVLRGTASGGPYGQIAVVAAPTLGFSDTGLTPGTYFYVVRAFAGCESGNSNEASATAVGGTCTTQTVYTNGFESGTGLSDWTTGTFVTGGSTASWRGIQVCTAETGANIFRFGGTACTTDYSSNNFNFSKPNGATGIAIPAGATQTRLSFGHRRRFETNFDGGTIAVSVNGTNYTYVPASAILSGPVYNGTISASCPPAGAAGASVWTGVQSTFVDNTIDLDAVCNLITGTSTGCAGRALHIAFTTISDCSVTDDGWFLDNVTVQACVP
jgi:hypothetical protein